MYIFYKKFNRLHVTVLILIVTINMFSTNYYLSNSTGNDLNDGSLLHPFKSLTKISSIVLLAGDSVFFKKNERFEGCFIFQGSGLEALPIVVTSYGEGNLPIISGQVGVAGGGDYREAIYVQNQDNIIFDGLEIQNERIITRSGVDSILAYGIHIHNSGIRVMRNLKFRNMTFKNVFAVKAMNNPEDFNGLEVAGLRFAADKNTTAGKEKHIRDVLVENCYFTNIQRLGIHIKHVGGSSGIGNDSLNKNMNIVVRNNEFFQTGGTCVLPSMTYNCLIENNKFDHPGSNIDPRMPARGSSVWTWRCINTVIQKNQCLHIRGYLDSHGIHIDHENKNTFVQYNYMKDCEGGFVEILGGNVNAVYRFNISENDGWRVNPGWVNSNHTIWINEKTVNSQIHHCDSSYIYNNTVYIDSAYSTAIDINAKNTFIFNNIFYTSGGGNIGGKQVAVNNNGTSLFMKNNLFSGTISSTFKNFDTNIKTGNPIFNTEGINAYRYELLEGSAAINAGVAKTGPAFPLAGIGIFKDIPVYPNVDFFGNPVDLSSGTPNIGACNSKTGLTTAKIDSIDKNKKFTIYPNPTVDFVNINMNSNKNELLNIRIIDMQGREVLQKNRALILVNQIFRLDIRNLSTSGVYLLTLYNENNYYSNRLLIIK